MNPDETLVEISRRGAYIYARCKTCGNERKVDPIQLSSGPCHVDTTLAAARPYIDCWPHCRRPGTMTVTDVR